MFPLVRGLNEKSRALTAIASAQARADDSEAARGIVEMIGSAARKAHALGIVATVQVEAGDRQGARKTIEAALESARKVGNPQENQGRSWQ